ncbi:LuxR C-terminal-related transcriptional regulator [Rhizobium sp. Root1204]|uniref:helix-turn-helix transcriptional regulator n=1 Tax=Rhizobium sp. Root1204 TaxID=1736428 RepID=UPI0007136497|nr:LuxR C-terminal-related transcriptional regulator [Rhizobium sp. Root1204]KQV41320.1 hypothetical protein ASC96_18685 [Rhizobium sp. Root1204]
MIYSRIEPCGHDPSVVPAITRLLETVGTPDFEHSIKSILSLCASVGEYIAFVRRTDEKVPYIVMSASECGGSARRAEAYRARYFRYDPINRLLDRSTPTGIYIARVKSEEILQSDYRQTCYVRPGFIEKLTLASNEKTPVVLSVFPKNHRVEFQRDEVERLSNIGQILLSVIKVHSRMTAGVTRTRRLTAEDVEVRLRANFPDLSGREVAVCARSLLGSTAEGIANDLGIKQTSVLTYRRRAYDRLNISSVHQLSTMLIQ